MTAPPDGRVGTCGTCAHGTAIDYGMVECALGWEVHDGLQPTYDPKTKRRYPAHLGHGDLLKPQATPDCRCGCPDDRWVPKKAAVTRR